MYPEIKDPAKYTHSDLSKLAKDFNKDKFTAIIDALTTDNHTGEPTFLTVLSSLIYDKDADLSVKLYNKMRELGMTISTTQYNYFLWNAAHYNNNEHTM